MAVHEVLTQDSIQPRKKPSPKKKLVKRTDVDRSQQLRHVVQFVFLVLNVCIGVQFYFFVRYFERGGHGTLMSRPAGVEGWLPIAALMNLRASLLTGTLPSVH